MEEMVVRLKLQPGVDPEQFRAWAMSTFSGMTGFVAQAEVDYADPEELREAIKFEQGGPVLEETAHFYIRISPEVRYQITRRAAGLFRAFHDRGVVRGQKALLAMLAELDPEVWPKGTPPQTLSNLYARLAERLSKSAWPLIRGRKGVYGFKHQEAITRQGKLSPRNRDFDADDPFEHDEED